MITYAFLQHYWWFLVSLLGAILVFLLFVQGANSQLFSLACDDDERRMIINSTGRKWEFTFTTLVTFGGAFFASFPLYYSTSFGGAYWLWMIILFTFVLQAVSYEFQNKMGNVLGTSSYQYFLLANGIMAPVLLGVAVASFYNGANFIVEKDNMTDMLQPVISRWASEYGGLDMITDVWNILFGMAVLFLARTLGSLYLINNVSHEDIAGRCRKSLTVNFSAFLVLFLAFLAHLLTKDGYAVEAVSGDIYMKPYKYLDNFIEMWYLIPLFLIGVLMVLYGVVRSVLVSAFRRGVWFAGIGVVMTVLSLLLCAGWNDTAYFPSNADLQSSLTIVNSCSSEFTLQTMAVVSLLIPFVLAYIFYAWRKIDSRRITQEELINDEAY